MEENLLIEDEKASIFSDIGLYRSYTLNESIHTIYIFFDKERSIILFIYLFIL